MMFAIGRAVAIAGFAGLFPAASLAQSSPARSAQEVFDVSNKESDYFEHTFRHGATATGDDYAKSLSFAGCLARISPQAAASVLTVDAGGGAEAKLIRDISKRYSACAATRATVSPVLVRGAIAETLWKQAGANPNPKKRTTVDIEDVESFIKAAPLGEQRVKAANLALSWVSRCQVVALPKEAAAVLAARPGSPEEKAAAEALYGRSNVCGVMKGLETTPPTLVRAGLADAFYQDGRMASLTSTD
jgi:hypothetical protein